MSLVGRVWISRPLLWRWGRRILRCGFQFKLDPADDSGGYVVNYRTDSAADKTHDPVKDWKGDHHNDSTDNRAYAPQGLIAATSLRHRGHDRSSKDDED